MKYKYKIVYEAEIEASTLEEAYDRVMNEDFDEEPEIIDMRRENFKNDYETQYQVERQIKNIEMSISKIEEIVKNKKED